MLVRQRAGRSSRWLPSHFLSGSDARADVAATAGLHKQAQPILEEFCYDCHSDGTKKGDIAFDELKPEDTGHNRDVWLKVLKNVRAGLVPPSRSSRACRRKAC